MRIAIYSGEGTNSFSLPGRLLSASDIISTSWDKTCSLFVMPGGRDRPYMAALQGSGNRRIRSFVENGGTYIGICAGAYYGAARLEFDKDHPLQVCEKRELAFFDGVAVGPAYGRGSYDYHSRRGARAAKILTASGATFYAYYNGGCTFEGDFSDCRILARFDELPSQPPAIIECYSGEGRAILSGIHLETSPHSLDLSDPYLAPLIPVLESTEWLRRQFWSNMVLSHLAKDPSADQMEMQVEDRLSGVGSVVRQ